MPGKPDADDWRVEHDGQIQFQSSIFSQAQPWWRGARENASKSSSLDQLNGRSVTIGATDKEGLADGVDYCKQTQHLVSATSSRTGMDVAKDHQLSTGKQPGPNYQMELVSHPIVLTSYPYPDAQYGGILTAYAQQAMLYGMHARMPLPLEMEEEPVYVNAKQYHGILRRRQSRAKAELEKKVVKVRKPYLHESRHLHAMRRARGCGGRFLNTKKLEGNNSNAQDNGNNTGASTNPSKISSSLNLGPSSGHHPDAPGSLVQHMHKVQSFPVSYDDGDHASSSYYLQLNHGGDCMAQERKILHIHGAPNGAVK